MMVHGYCVRLLNPAATPTMQWYMLYQFYPVGELVVPFAVVEASTGVANTIASPLAAALLSMDGLAGLVRRAAVLSLNVGSWWGLARTCDHAMQAHALCKPV